MKRIYTWKFAVIILISFLNVNLLAAQAKLVLNGAKIKIANGGNLVLANPAPDAIIRQSGHIISEGENNLVKWNMGNTTGTYTVPFGFGNADYLPLIFTKSAGSGNGNYLFSTYQTNWQNSRSLPTGVTNLTGSNQDNSAFVLDRFWRIDAKEFSTAPSITNLSFTYLESELSDENNNITESALGLQGWNDNTKSWSDFQPLGELDANTNTLKVASFPSEGPYKWWALVDKSSPLPLDFISFEASKVAKTVKLNWVTANEINCLNFEIQRSADARNFTSISTIKAANSALNEYNYIDNFPLNGTSYYRLKQNDGDGTSKYTPIRTITNSPAPEISIYPNPTQNRKVQVLLQNSLPDKCTVALFDLNGKVVSETSMDKNENSIQLDFPALVKPGMYILKVFNNSFSYQSKLIIN